MNRHFVFGVVALAFFLVVPINAVAKVNVIYVNGIQNTLEDAIKGRNKIEEILTASENHSGDEKRVFSVWLVWNPIGFTGSTKGPDIKQDGMELFLLKAAEEEYGEDFLEIMVPFNESKSPDIEAAMRVIFYLDNMTLGKNKNSLEADGLISDEDMFYTQRAVLGIVSSIEALDSAVVVAHSEGNLLANLAYAKIVSKSRDDAFNMIRVINVANTSAFSVNGLNFTHAGDAALYSEATAFGIPNLSLENLPTKLETWRTTPWCSGSDCNFVIAPPTFEEYSDDIGFLDHTFIGTYLSDDNVFLGANDLGVSFTSDAERFVDRFEDFVYTAAESLDVPNSVDSDGDGYNYYEGDCDDSDFSVYPDAEEVCDGVDNNCDGLIDEECDVASVELKNDDGSVNYSYGWQGTCIGASPIGVIADGVAGYSAYLTPLSYPFFVSKVSINFARANSSGYGFYLHIEDSSGNDLLPTPMLIPVSEFDGYGWWEKDISEFGIEISDGIIRVSVFESYLAPLDCTTFEKGINGWRINADDSSYGKSVSIRRGERVSLSRELMIRVSGY